METYIALLRGINVSGQKQIKMVDLKDSLEKAGLQKVRTYIQSGNVIFEHAGTDPASLANQLGQIILQQFGFEVEVIVTTPAELEEVLQNNPFLSGREENTKQLYVTFLSDQPAPASIDNLAKVDYSPEEYSIKGKQLYFLAANGYGKAKLNNNLIESKLKVTATTRNWNTMNKLAELAKQ